MVKMNIKKWREMATAVLLVSLVGLSLLAPGCVLFVAGAAAGAGAAGVAYVKGVLEATLKDDPKTVETAADKAFETLAIVKISSHASALDAKIVGRTATDTRIEIIAKAIDSGGSKLSIRVGTFGDQEMSRKIYDEILKRLPKH